MRRCRGVSHDAGCPRGARVRPGPRSAPRLEQRLGQGLGPGHPQVALDPKSGQLIDGDVVAQTERVLDNLGAVLAAAGCTFADVVKTTIYLVDLGDFQAVNQIYAKRFVSAPPARATVQVSALPRGARVEIDAIARAK